VQLRIFTEPQQGTTYDELMRVAVAAEDLGFDGFFCSDHYVKEGDTVDGMPGPCDAWTTLAGLARDTNRIRLGTLVSSATFRLPGPLAVIVAQVDQMSGGRVELGLGAGWYDTEHTAYGIPFPPLGERFDRLAEQLAVITGIWDTPADETFSHDGKHYQLLKSPALPKPAQRPRPPILVGGTGLRHTPRLAARYADEFNLPMGSIYDSRTAFERVRVACHKEGRDTEPIYSVLQTLCCGATDAEVDRRVHNIGGQVDELRRRALAGSPAQLVDKLGRFAAAGARRAYLQLLDLSDVDHLELVASEVLPHVA
jgi:F420-dependent oxidoreductase-like protein